MATVQHPTDDKCSMRKLLLDIVEELEEEDYDNLLFFSKDILGEETYSSLKSGGSSKAYQFLTELENKLESDERALCHMWSLMERTKFHGRFGQNFEQLIQRYWKGRQDVVAGSSLVGRRSVVRSIVHHLEDEKQVKVAIVCGESGMGKTSIGNQVCWVLQKNWIMYKVDQREKQSLWELLQDMIWAIQTEDTGYLQIRTNYDVRDLTSVLLFLLMQMKTRKQGVVFYLDNLDGHCDTEEKQEDLLNFLKHVLSVETTGKIRLLITVKQKIVNFRTLEMPKDFGDSVVEFQDNNVLQVELKPLFENDAVWLLRKVLSNSVVEDMLDEECKKIVSACNGLPITLHLLATLLKNGCLVGDLLPNTDLFTITGPGSLFTQKFSELFQEEMDLLWCLFPFRTAGFSPGTCKTIVKRDTLEMLHSLSLIEKNRFETQSQSEQGQSQPDEAYDQFSIHPVIVDLFTDDCTNSVKMATGRNQFLMCICEKIERCGRSVGTETKAIEKHWVHFQEFFKVIRLEKLSLRDIIEKSGNAKDKPILCTVRCIWAVADLVLHYSERKMFARIQAGLERECKILSGYLYWIAVEADNFDMEGRPLEAKKLVDSVSSEIGIEVKTDGIILENTEGWERNASEEKAGLATFCFIHARIKHALFGQLGNREELSLALRDLSVAEHLLEGKLDLDIAEQPSDKKSKRNYRTTDIFKKVFKTDLGDIQNLKGCVCVKLKKFETARQCHDQAIRYVDAEHRLETVYRTNLAVCIHQQAAQVSGKEREERLKEALKLYNQLAETNETHGWKVSYSQAGILRNRAEIYSYLKLYEQAVEDAEFVLEVLEKRYPKHHVEVTLAVERLARYYHGNGQKIKVENKGNYRACFEKSQKLYDRLLTGMEEEMEAVPQISARRFKLIKEKHGNVLCELQFEPEKVADIHSRYLKLEEKIGRFWSEGRIPETDEEELRTEEPDQLGEDDSNSMAVDSNLPCSGSE